MPWHCPVGCLSRTLADHDLRRDEAIFLIVDRGPAHIAKKTRAFVDSQHGRLRLSALGAGHQALEKLDEDRGITPPFSLIMNRIWPRAVIAEIRLMRWRAPVVLTMGVAPLLPHVRPA